MERFREDCQNSESARCDILTGIDALLANLLMQDDIDCGSAAKLTPIKGVQLLPEEVDYVLSTGSSVLVLYRDLLRGFSLLSN